MSEPTGAPVRPHILVGITGGIAAYKSVQLVRTLCLAGCDVRVVMTEAATRFVGRATFEAISGNPVYEGLYEGVAEVRHIALALWCDEIVIAPATADTLARLAAGRADDLLTATALAGTSPVVVAPAMHTGMWENPATQANLATLRRRGVHVVGPEEGRLTSGDVGVGRMSDPEAIAAAARALRVGGRAGRSGPLAGKRVVITAGGTREPLDPVRFLGNRSTGRQGVLLAEEAARRGADVTLIAAHLEVAVPAGVRRVDVSTALDMRQSLRDTLERADVVVMCAAVADFRPAASAVTKIKKDSFDEKAGLRLVRNPDILAEVGALAERSFVLVGFAAETEPDRTGLVARGRAKLAAKRCDFLVVNAVGWRSGFGAGEATAFLLSAADDIVTDISGPKARVAEGVLDAVASRLGGASA
ncbi:MAG TPA: bifunctional phosphopantothenoylcysteine decarboxylase/phosphopantothenate--cysteine ligase CoaBC [Microbacteriaceae bacterium]|nr:bifunctional phosphopantothenoylcysteine decarboxylase/phosphopantothenate--cysteine ligase CoaBC [Microbacteriaceae bacterium]